MRFKFTYVPAKAPTVEPTTDGEKFIERARQTAESHFAGRKTARKQRSNTIHAELATKLRTSADTVQTFRAFEKNYLEIGADTASIEMMLPTVLGKINNLYAGGWGKPKPYQVIFDRTEPGKVVIKVAYDGCQTKVIGTLFHGTERYVLAANAEQPPRVLHQVFCRREQVGQHYISYANGNETLFVRRYVIRGLNQSDAANIAAGRDLAAPYSTAESTNNELWSTENRGKFAIDRQKQNLTIEEQILSHTRGWAKRFVSTTVTQHKVYSTRGTEFRSVFGAVIVDLAKVPGDRIYDIHAPGSLTRFKVTAGKLHTVPHQGDPRLRSNHDEQLLAARDALRTRELLIHHSVPHSALELKDCGACVLGIRVAGGDGAKESSQLEFAAQERRWGNAHPYKGTDCPEYRVDSCWVKYYRFETPAAVALARAAVPVPLRDNTVVLNVYDFPDDPPVGFPR